MNEIDTTSPDYCRMIRDFLLLEPFKLDKAKIRELLKQEIAWVIKNWGAPITLKALAFMLYKTGDLEDIGLIWQAKTASFDCFYNLDVEFLAGKSSKETIGYLKTHPLIQSNLKNFLSPNGEDIVTYIISCEAAGDFAARYPTYMDDLNERLIEELNELIEGD